VRIEGPLLEVPKIEADEYFQSRPRESRIGAWSSKQSQYLPKGYESLTEQIKYYEKKFHNKPVPRPSFWSGRIVVPEKIEFWKDVKSRLHERVLFTPQSENWLKEFLYP
jgi:pyridoxamine 5'-phosphate oxidase